MNDRYRYIVSRTKQACYIYIYISHIQGLYHLGVAKTLFEHGLLPRIISGSSAGAMIASLVCCRTTEELPTLFRGEVLDLNFFEKIETTSKAKGFFANSFFRRLKRLLTKGTLLDIAVLRSTIRVHIIVLYNYYIHAVSIIF